MSEIILINSDEHSVNNDKAYLRKIVDIPLESKGKYKVELIKLKMPHAINNIITGTNDTFRISHDAGANWTTITIPAGMYELETLQQVIIDKLIELTYYSGEVGNYSYDYMLYYNESTNKCFWLTKNNNYWIDLTNNGTSEFNKIIGFTTTTLLQNATSYVATSDADFAWRDGNAFRVKCNLVGGNSDPGIIYEGQWQTSPLSLELFPSASETHFQHTLNRSIVSSGRISRVELEITKVGSHEHIPFNTSTSTDDNINITLGLTLD